MPSIDETKFLVRNQDKRLECPVCSNHKYLIQLRIGKHHFITTSFGYPSSGKAIHFWITIPPECLKAFDETGGK